MYESDECVVVFRVFADGTTVDLLCSTVRELIGSTRPHADVSDLLDTAARRVRGGLPGGWRLHDTK